MLLPASWGDAPNPRTDASADAASASLAATSANGSQCLALFFFAALLLPFLRDCQRCGRRRPAVPFLQCHRFDLLTRFGIERERANRCGGRDPARSLVRLRIARQPGANDADYHHGDQP